MGLEKSSSASQQQLTSPVTTTTTITGTGAVFKVKLTAAEHMLASQGATAVSTIAVYPIDFIRMRFMSQDGTVHRQHNGQTYGSVAKAFATVYREEGVRAFFRGCHVAVLGSVTAWGIYMFLYRSLCNVLDASSSYKPGSDQDHVATFLRSSLVSGIASFSSAILCNPIWLIKTRMQLEEVAVLKSRSSTLNYSSFIHGLVFAARTDGFLSLWRGVSAQILLGLPNALYLPIYESLKTYSLQHTGRVSLDTYETFLYPSIAKLIVTCSAHPIQVLKTRLQDHRRSCGELRYTSIIQSMRLIWKIHGWRGAYRGFIPSCLQTLPRSVLTIALYECFVDCIAHRV